MRNNASITRATVVPFAMVPSLVSFHHDVSNANVPVRISEKKKKTLVPARDTAKYLIYLSRAAWPGP